MSKRNDSSASTSRWPEPSFVSTTTLGRWQRQLPSYFSIRRRVSLVERSLPSIRPCPMTAFRRILSSDCRNISRDGDRNKRRGLVLPVEATAVPESFSLPISRQIWQAVHRPYFVQENMFMMHEMYLHIQTFLWSNQHGTCRG